MIDLRTVRGWLPTVTPSANKDDRGRVLVVGGSARYSGAPLLAALGAARTGAGIVTLAVPRSLALSLAGRAPVVTFLPLDEAAPGVSDASAARQIGEALGEGHYGAAVLGPGLGHDPTTDALVRGVLARATVPLVIDADGLNSLAREEGWPARLPPGTILTPHHREAERLHRGPVGADPASWTREKAMRWGCVVVLKSACTIVSSASQTFVHDRPNAALATAGTGDVLAGCIAALLASGLDPFRAACAGVAAHGEAGALVASEVGVRGALATDVVDRLPRAIASLAAR